MILRCAVGQQEVELLFSPWSSIQFSFIWYSAFNYVCMYVFKCPNEQTSGDGREGKPPEAV